MTTTKYRPGTHNGPPTCIHGKSMKVDNCLECKRNRDHEAQFINQIQRNSG